MKTILNKTLFTILICLAVHSENSFSQSNKTDKKFEKAKELAKDGKIEEADKYLTDLLKESPDYGKGWDFLSRINYKEYVDSKSSDNMSGKKINISMKDKDGKDIENDSLANQLSDMLNNMKPYKKAYNKYIYTMRKGTLLASDANECSLKLRNHFIDPEVDTNVSKKALRYFEDAEKEFEKENYGDASKLYKRAIEAQPDFYKASLYLGDSYYFMGNYQDAINSFKSAIGTFPKLIEPRKYLIDAYMKEKLYSDAMDEIIKAYAVYPDNSLNQRMEDAAYMSDKKVDINWTPREIFPNKFESTSEKLNLNVYEDPDSLVAKGKWKIYASAADKIKDKCSEKGIITQPTPLTKSRYLEEYSWEEMLNNSKDPSLDEARKMQRDGYLDCYVLVTCYHFDLYDQYKDLVSQNSSKISEYFKKYIVPKSVLK